MDYRVEITETALADIEAYVAFIRDERKEPDAASEWLSGLIAAVSSLEKLPDRCAHIPEANEFEMEMRHQIYHSHRIIFRAERKRRLVTVYRVYHSSRQQLRPGDIIRR